MNKKLRIKIIETIMYAGEGHIPSSFSIIDIIDYLYSKVLKINKRNFKNKNRNYFILSKGHGCVALYVVLEKIGIISNFDLINFCSNKGILGGHPDKTKIPGVEASTGSLGHGLPTAVGVALGLKIKKKLNKVFVLLGDGESHEGTIWESANIAANLKLNNLCVVVDWNGSAAQLMPIDNLKNKWRAFGWNVHYLNDGHNYNKIKKIFKDVKFNTEKPNVIIAKTIKGKGVSFMEGHGKWHHRTPNEIELKEALTQLND